MKKELFPFSKRREEGHKINKFNEVFSVEKIA